MHTIEQRDSIIGFAALQMSDHVEDDRWIADRFPEGGKFRRGFFHTILAEVPTPNS
jgi:hypothetical protein